METRTYNVYDWDELPAKSKEKALDNYRDINVDHDWWEDVYYDAELINLKITEFDTVRGTIDGEFTATDGGEFATTTDATAQAILDKHGPDTATYKLAKAYLKDKAEGKSQMELSAQFHYDLLQEYLEILRSDFEYLTTDEAVADSLRANEYKFTEDGRIDR